MKIVSLFLFAFAAFTATAYADTRGGPMGPDGSCRVERGLVILAEFPDIKHNIKREYAKKRFFRGLNGYVQEMSYGKVCIKGDVTEKWITLPEPVEKYRISSRNLEVDKDRVRKLIDEALKGADKDIDFSGYSFVVIFLGAKLKEYGMIGLCGYPGMLGWSSEDQWSISKEQPLMLGGNQNLLTGNTVSGYA